MKVSIPRLIFIPGLITLGVTILRLAGELQRWSKTWFNPAAGGPWSLVGITWLAPVFGIYFALKLSARGERPTSAGRSLGFATLGFVLAAASLPLSARLQVAQTFQGRLIYYWSAFALAALVTWPGWPALFKTMLVYAYAARIPVALVMYFAFRESWGTHYDAPPPNLPPGMALWPKYLWLGFFPQLTYWVGFTVVVGMLFGGLVAAVRPRRQVPQASP